MCIICLEFNKNRDLRDAEAMVAAARREPRSIDPGHLDEVERQIQDMAQGRRQLADLEI